MQFRVPRRFCMYTRVAVYCAVLGGLLWTQEWTQASTSVVRGTVRDQSQAAIVNAAVALTGADTNVVSRTATNEAGFFIFPGVVPGPYRLTVESPGMTKYEAKLTAQVQLDVAVDVVLQVG